MKIYKYEDFKKLPIGTVFSYYEPCVFRDLCIKDSGPEYDIDFTYSDLIGAVENVSSEDFGVKCELMEMGESQPVDFNYSGREGMFDDKQLYAVYEKEDVEKLIERLKTSLKQDK